MNLAIAQYILKSLLERCERSSSEVFLTSVEVDALKILLGLDVIKEEPIKNSAIDKKKEEAPICIVFPTPAEIDTEHLMCLDFGTSFSKAFACSSDEDEVPDLFPLPFGVNDAGDPLLLLPSELFIDNGEVFLGAAARQHFDVVEAPQDRLIDSPKQFITLSKDVGELHKKPLAATQDPSGVLTQRDALVLYLAHLNLRAEDALMGHKLSVDIKRRYAHPAWTPANFAKNSTEMKRIIAEAIAIGRCFGSYIRTSVSFDLVKKILHSARQAQDADLPFGLIHDPVLEATAAGAGALTATPKKHRTSYVVLDIGAGTTDVAGCVCVNNPERGRVIAAEVRSAARAIPLAGNIIDNALLKMILNESGLAEGTEEYRRVDAALKRDIRREKEQLFSTGAIAVGLVTGDVVTVELDQFLKQPVIVNLFAKITDLVQDAAFCVAGDQGVVNVAASGGGAALPVVKMLDGKVIVRDARRIQLKLANPMPKDLEERYPQLADSYAQIAVAVGGSMPSLPAQVASVSEGIADPGRRYLAPMYRT
jgi:molecular chaperone DnaK